MNAPVRSLVPPHPYRLDAIAPGVTLRRLHPGGKAGPDNATANDIAGGQTWSEIVLLGDESDDFIFAVPDIRLPPNQLWPMHWHDCWTVVVIIEGKCLIGDWYMEEGDVFVAAPSIEYGPLVIGTMGCRMLEIFGNLALSPGGYGPEYRDHPTLRAGNHAIKPREGINKRNEGHSSLSLEGAEGMWKTQLTPGWEWDLGDPGDSGRGVVRHTVLGEGETLAGRSHGDWYSALVLGGSGRMAGRAIERDDVLLAERDKPVPDVVAGPDGLRILESFRTARAL